MSDTSADGWYQVDLDSLRLKPAEEPGWPLGMTSSKSGMIEECLESVIALNLDVLFPGEALQLVSIQNQINSMADVTAIDPLGCLRLIEVKPKPTDLDELQAQALTYAMKELNLGASAWHDDLAFLLGAAPEWVGLAFEGFRLNARAKGFGAAEVGDSDRTWIARTRVARAQRIIEVLRGRRGATPSTSMGLEDAAVQTTIARLFGVEGDTLRTSELADVRDACLRRWVGREARTGVEVTVVAPNAATLDVSNLETRCGVYFHLLEAELRRTREGNVTRSALLRWRPAHRTASVAGDARARMAHFFRVLRGVHAEAAAFTWDPKSPENGSASMLRWSVWPTYYVHIWGDLREITTGSTNMTQGTCAPERERRARVDALAARGLDGVDRVNELRSNKKSERWRTRDDDAAARLVAAYYKIGKELGAFDCLRYYAR